ncbi:MAG: putative membrane-anchored protein, partial [Planctomycetota bacterium]
MLRSAVRYFRQSASFLWRWSLLATVPAACLFLLWVSRTGGKFMDLGVQFQSLNESMSLHRIGGFEAEGLA